MAKFFIFRPVFAIVTAIVLTLAGVIAGINLPIAQYPQITLPTIPADCTHNAHMFYIKAKDLEERTALISFLKQNDILAVFHYIPLHTAPAGEAYGRFNGEDVYTTKESERLVRLPMYYKLQPEQIDYICDKVKEFYHA